MSESIETKQEFTGAQGTARYWAIELQAADDEEKDWRKEGREVLERYRAEEGHVAVGREKRFNILYSNVETLKGTLFARMAKPDVRRRYLDQDPAGRKVATLLERALEYSNDVNDEEDIIAACIEDSLLPGRGVIWVEYERVEVEVERLAPVMDGDVMRVDEFGVPVVEPVMETETGDQRCWFEYLHWEDYRESPAKRPEDVRWKARRHLYSRQQLRDEKFNKADDVPLNWTPKKDKKDIEDVFKRAEVWEIWCKETRKRYYVVKGFPTILREEDDPYGLEKFFPTPHALVPFKTNGSGVPIPEYRFYKHQADELDRLTTRIARLTDALRRRGVYDSAVAELSKLAEAGDNVFIPSENFASLAQKGGLQGAFQVEDISGMAQVLAGLYQQREQLIQSIYEVTGISDVIRGATDPDETATAQRLKGQFGSMRLKKRQGAVQRYIRDLYRIRAEMVGEQYEPHVLQEMTGIPVDDEMLQIMRADKLRSYRIDIETDSTVFEDAEAEKTGRIEFVNTLGAFLEKALPVATAAPELTPLIFQAMEFMVRGWKIGREFEDVIEEAKQQVMQAQQQKAQMAQQAPPDPKMIEVEQKAKAKQAELQMQGQMGAAKLQQEAQADMARLQQEGQIKREEMVLDAEITREKNAMDAEAKAQQVTI